MVRALAPFRQHCSACNWRGRVITGHSDAIFISDFASDIRATCPKCGKAGLEFEAVSDFSANTSQFIDFIEGFCCRHQNKKGSSKKP